MKREFAISREAAERIADLEDKLDAAKVLIQGLDNLATEYVQQYQHWQHYAEVNAFLDGKDDAEPEKAQLPSVDSMDGPDWAAAVMQELPSIPEHCRARLAEWFQAALDHAYDCGEFQ